MTAKKSIVSLGEDEDAEVRALSPVSTSGPNRGSPSLSLALRELLEIGRLARPLVRRGELPWPAVRAAVQAEVERRAPRRGRA
jgi:hypothetical protein